MARLFEVLAGSAAVLLAMSFGLGLSASGSWEQGARWHVRIGLASTAVCLVAHLSAIALLGRLGRRIRKVEADARGRIVDEPSGRFEARSVRNANRAAPLASVAGVLVALAALLGLLAERIGADRASIAHLGLSSMALGFSLPALGVEVVSIRSQRRLLFEAASTGLDPPEAPRLPRPPIGASPLERPDG